MNDKDESLWEVIWTVRDGRMWPNGLVHVNPEHWFRDRDRVFLIMSPEATLEITCQVGSKFVVVAEVA